MISYVVANAECSLDEKLLKLTDFVHQERRENCQWESCGNGGAFMRQAMHQWNILGCMDRHQYALLRLAEGYAASPAAPPKIVDLYAVSLPAQDVAVLTTNAIKKLINMDLNILSNEELIICGCVVWWSEQREALANIYSFILSLIDMSTRRGSNQQPMTGKEEEFPA
jgi:alpha-galactosidase